MRVHIEHSCWKVEHSSQDFQLFHKHILECCRRTEVNEWYGEDIFASLFIFLPSIEVFVHKPFLCSTLYNIALLNGLITLLWSFYLCVSCYHGTLNGGRTEQFCLKLFKSTSKLCDSITRWRRYKCLLFVQKSTNCLMTFKCCAF